MTDLNKENATKELADNKESKIKLKLPQEKPNPLDEPSGNPDYDLEHQEKLINLEMSQFILESARAIRKEIMDLEKKKTTWRDKILKWLLRFLIGSIFLLIFMAFFEAMNWLQISNTLILSILGSIVTQIIAIFTIFVKFINDNKHLEMYKTLTESIINHKNQKYKE